MIYLKTEEEINILKENGKIVGKTLAEVAKYVKPGISTILLNQKVLNFLENYKAKYLLYKNEDFSHCFNISINNVRLENPLEEVILKDGDILTVYCEVLNNKFYNAVTYTFQVGLLLDKKLLKILEYTKSNLLFCVENVDNNKRIGDLNYFVDFENSEIIGDDKKKSRDKLFISAHGIGKNKKEDPNFLKFNKKGRGPLVKKGLVLNLNSGVIINKSLLITYFGCTIVIKKEGKAEILTPFDYLCATLGDKFI